MFPKALKLTAEDVKQAQKAANEMRERIKFYKQFYK